MRKVENDYCAFKKSLKTKQEIFFEAYAGKAVLRPCIKAKAKIRPKSSCINGSLNPLCSLQFMLSIAKCQSKFRSGTKIRFCSFAMSRTLCCWSSLFWILFVDLLPPPNAQTHTHTCSRILTHNWQALIGWIKMKPRRPSEYDCASDLRLMVKYFLNKFAQACSLTWYMTIN